MSLSPVSHLTLLARLRSVHALAAWIDEMRQLRLQKKAEIQAAAKVTWCVPKWRSILLFWTITVAELESIRSNLHG
jgi:hypothetical protein